MRAPRIRVRARKVRRRLKLKIRNTGCPVCQVKPCRDENKGYICDRTTRSLTKLRRELSEVIIYETYRCMPLLGDEKVHAPDWEEHIVRYHIVFVKKSVKC